MAFSFLILQCAALGVRPMKFSVNIFPHFGPSFFQEWFYGYIFQFLYFYLQALFAVAKAIAPLQKDAPLFHTRYWI